jgi:hypothetical protein
MAMAMYMCGVGVGMIAAVTGKQEKTVEQEDKSVDLDWDRRGNEVVHCFSHR